MRLVANTLRGAGLLASSVGLLLIACDDNSSDSADAGEHAHAHDEEGGAGGKAGAGGKGADGGDSDAGHGGKGGTGGAIDSGGAGGKGGAGGASDMGGSGGAGGKAATGGKGAAAGAGGAGAADTLEVKIRFKAMVGDKDFACNTNYESQGKGSASTITPQDMRLFIQDLALIKEDGSKAAVTFEDRAPWQSGTVALLDFEDNKGGCVEGTKETNTELTGTVAKGTYKGISFVNGVPENLNHADPTMFPEPLKTSANLSWNWLTGFRFSKIEVVNTKPGETDLGRAFFHPGSTACTGNPMQGTVKCGKSNRSEIVFEEFDADMDTVIIDVAALFKNTDLEVGSECHSTPAEICTPMFDAWGLNFSNGGTKSGQTVFRRE